MTTKAQDDHGIPPAARIHAIGARHAQTRPLARLLGAAFNAAVLAAAIASGINAISDEPTPLDAAHVAAPARTSASGTDSPPPQNDVPSDAAPSATEPAPEDYDLPIALSENDGLSQITIKLLKKGHIFQALAVQAEGIETKPYYIEGDPSQPSIGVGYNIRMSATAIGTQGVRRELFKAGIPGNQVAALLSRSQSVSARAHITDHQALALLDIATHRFEGSTRAAIGPAVFDRLPEHRQAALMWIDYNSNIHERPKLVAAVRAGDHEAAVLEMETWATVHGKRIRNPQTVLAQAIYHDPENVRAAVLDPRQLRAAAKTGDLPWLQKKSDTTSVPDAAPDLNQWRSQRLDAVDPSTPKPGSSPDS